MTPESEDLIVSFEVEIDGAIRRFNGSGLSILPSVGNQVEFNYVEGEKFRFEVTSVKHFLSSMAQGLLQQITVHGRII